jgi:phage-related protein
LWQNFEKIAKWFEGLPSIAKVGVGAAVTAILVAMGPLGAIVGLIAGIIAAIKTNLFGLIDWFKTNIIAPLKKTATWINTTIIQPIFESIKKVISYAKEKYTELKDGIIASVKPIIDKIVEIHNKIKEIFVALKGAFFEYLWNPLAEKVGAFYEDKIKPVVDKVKNAFTSIANWFKEKVYNQILKQVETMKERIEKLGKGIVDAIAGTFKLIMNNLFSRIENFLNIFILALNGAIKLINKIPGVNISTVEYLSIPRLAEGGIVNEGQMFIAREAGPELVGSIGRKTAVANNDQIISGIESGVYRAMVAANSNNSGGSQTIRIINEIDGDIVGEKVIQYHNGKVIQTGVSPLLV